jgi:hypothetical protein
MFTRSGGKTISRMGYQNVEENKPSPGEDARGAEGQYPEQGDEVGREVFDLSH